jgi:hypothetical protein
MVSPIWRMVCRSYLEEGTDVKRAAYLERSVERNP